tara:strand:+ start:87 stop:461 length:375 start_codon:yes stop_codon:yes gene_type:complete
MDKDKGKKKREKKEKKEALKKALEEQKNKKEDNSPKEEKPSYDVNVPINFEFLCNVYNLLLTSNSRISWEPDELIPIGVTLRDLKGMITYYEKVILQKQEELKEEEIKDDEESSTSASETSTPA